MMRRTIVVGDAPACGGSVLHKMKDSLKAVKSNPTIVKTNADNISGYVVWGERYVG